MRSGIHWCVQKLNKVARTWYSMVQEETRFSQNGEQRKQHHRCVLRIRTSIIRQRKNTRVALSRTLNMQYGYRMSINED